MSSSKVLKVDKTFLTTVLFLVFFGFTVFLSASMNLLAKDSAQFITITFRQAFFGLLLGLIACFIFTKINYKLYRKFSLWIFLGTFSLLAFVFIPGIGIALNGSTRWINFFGLTTFQPIEFFNIGFIVYWAAWLALYKDKIQKLRFGIIPLFILLCIASVPLILQPDIDSIFFLGLVGIIMFLTAGGKFRHALLIGLIGVICIVIIAFAKPYVMNRITSYLNPGDNPLTSGYQIRQSLIAVGSGKIFGRGLGQGIQKFKFLPESISDSIFAVLGEEMGFVGCVFIILTFLFLVFGAFRIAIKSQDAFGGLLVLGIVILIISRSFMNIGSMLGVVPISGVPLAFFSQGGTAMLITLSEVGIILNVSKFNKNKK